MFKFSTLHFSVLMALISSNGYASVIDTQFDNSKGTMYTSDCSLPSSGSGNTAYGKGTGCSNTGDGNVSVGAWSGSNVNGNNNVTIAGGNNVTGNSNATFGNWSGDSAKGSYNSIFGSKSGMRVSGSYNTASGSHSLSRSNGDYNIASGYGAANSITGNNNIAIGQLAQTDITSINNDTSAIVGKGLTSNNTVAIGTKAKSTKDNGVSIGNNADVETENSVALGSYSVANNVTSTSSTTIAGKKYIFSGGAANGTVSIGSAGQERTITNVAAGRVESTSTDAVNGSQLYATNQAVENVNNKVDSVQTQVNNIASGNKNNVAYSDDTHESIKLSSANGGTTSMSGLADGKVESGSTSAVTGNQLWETNQKVNQNTTNISNLENKVNNSGIGIVQKDSNTKEITIGKNDDGKNINVSGTEGNRVVSGVDNGVSTYDAVNYGQLQSYSSNAKNYTDSKAKDTLNQANQYTDNKFRQLDKKINRKNQKQDSGIASAVAIGSIPQNWQYQDHLGMGVGGYNGQGSIAAKYGHKLRDNVALSLSVGLDTMGSTAYGAGVDIGW